MLQLEDRKNAWNALLDDYEKRFRYLLEHFEEIEQMPKEKEFVDPFGQVTPYADKDEFVSKQLSFDILKVEYETGKGFEGADRWLLEVAVQRGDEKVSELLTFGPNAARDEVYNAASIALREGHKLEGYTLVKSGRAYYINKVK